MFGISGFGLAIGPVIGGILTTIFNWKAIFFIMHSIILISFLLCTKNLPESRARINDKIDIIGVALLAISLPLLIFATVNTHIVGWFSVQTLFLFVLTLILFFIFVLQENKTSFPVINFHLFAKQPFFIGLIANFFLAFFYSINLFFIPLHLHQLDNFSSEKIGFLLLYPTIMVALISPLSGILCDRFGSKIILTIGYACFITSAFLQILFYNDLQLHPLLISLILFGIGWACILSPSLITAMSSLPEEMGGVAIGTIGTLHNFGGTLGLAIGSILSYIDAMHLILFTSAISLFIILLGFIRFKNKSFEITILKTKNLQG